MSVSKIFIDTNIFLRTLIKEDEVSFQECKSLLKAIKTNQISAVTASLVLAEVMWTLQSFYKFSKQQSITGVQSIVNLRGIKIIDNYNHRKALNWFKTKSVKYIDALIASIEQISDKKWPVVSYDSDFDKLNVKRLEPAEVIKKD